MKPFYVTTPIYYVNDKPHIGHAYSTVAADVLARYARLRGAPVRFLTGTDEHGQKIEDSAKALGLLPQTFVDGISPRFKECFEALSCSFDDYIRTTEPRHKERVQRLWKTMADKGDIYLGEYEGWYSVADEAYITETELEALDPVTRAKVKRMSEPSYFFKLSEYGDRLLALYEKNPDFVRPAGRFNEVKSFVREGLRDVSMSRTSFKWGIEVPGDPEHVMWVWCDALTNYISALGGPAEPGESPLFDEFWGEQARQVHIVGKDILRFHAVYWPAFLMSAGIDPPSQVWAHGWLTINGEKMSKRLGNFIPPAPLVETFGPDVVRYYLSREVAFGQDGDFSHKNVLARYNGELANGLGNLLNRMIASIVKNNLGGKVPPRPTADEPADVALREKAAAAAERAASHLDDIAPHRALDAIWELVGAANKYVDETAPWALAKQGNTARLEAVAYNTLEALRWLSVMIAPFMPGKAAGLRTQLGIAPLSAEQGADRWPSQWGELEPGIVTQPGEALFPRVDKKREKEILAGFGLDAEGKPARAGGDDPPKTMKSKNPKKQKSATKAEPAVDDGFLKFDDFLKVELKVGLIKTAEALPKSDKLVKLQIDLGEPALRQVLAGIREHYQPEDLVGQRVVVVANLAPRKIMGVESQGMVLAAKDDAHGLSVLTIDKAIDPGTRVT